MGSSQGKALYDKEMNKINTICNQYQIGTLSPDEAASGVNKVFKDNESYEISEISYALQTGKKPKSTFKTVDFRADAGYVAFLLYYSYEPYNIFFPIYTVLGTFSPHPGGQKTLFMGPTIKNLNLNGPQLDSKGVSKSMVASDT